jgi:hypothetical protein
MPYNPKSAANLIPCPPGKAMNPTGKNGSRRRGDMFRDWADDKPELVGDLAKSRITNVWEQVYRDAMDTRPQSRPARIAAQALFVQQYQGLAVAGLELMGPDGGPVQFSGEDPRTLTSEQREQRRAVLLEAGRARRTAATQEGVITVTTTVTHPAASALPPATSGAKHDGTGKG